MSIRIRCSECTKKISVDDAFAGGVCRCPYCKALVMVPTEAAVAVPASARPAAPRPAAPTPGVSRPAAPQAVAPQDRAAAPAPAASNEAAKALAVKTAPPATRPPVSQVPIPPAIAPRGDQPVPMAKPIRMQGYFGMLLIGILLLAVIGSIAWFTVSRLSRGQITPSRQGLNPFDASSVSGASVANDVTIDPPVVYVIDAGSSMSGKFDVAATMARVSILSLGKNQKFTILLSTGRSEAADGDKASATGTLAMPSGYRGGAAEGEQAAKKFLEDFFDSNRAGIGRSDILQTLSAAMDLEPKTLVVFARKDVTDEQAKPIIDKAKKVGAKIVTIVLDSEGQTDLTITKLARETGGESRNYSFQTLSEWTSQYLQKNQ